MAEISLNIRGNTNSVLKGVTFKKTFKNNLVFLCLFKKSIFKLR